MAPNDKVAAQRYLLQFVSQSQAECYGNPIATGRQLSFMQHYRYKSLLLNLLAESSL